MPESIYVTINSSLPTDKKTGALLVKVDDFATTDIDGSQDLFLADGGNITDLKITKMGKDDAKPDSFNFDLAAFDDDFTVNIKSEGPEDSFIIDNATSWTETSGVYTINYSGSDGNDHTVVIDPGDANVIINLVCFTAGTMIDTAAGPRAIEALRPGDLVQTLDHGAQPVRWIGRRRVVFSDPDCRFKPVRVRAGAMDGTLPRRDLLLSPQHRVLLRGAQVRDRFGTDEVLGPVKGLLGWPGFRKAFGRDSIEYITLLFDRHEVIRAEGMAVESFLPRDYARDYLAQDAVARIAALIPGVFDRDGDTVYPAARPLVTVAQMREGLPGRAPERRVARPARA